MDINSTSEETNVDNGTTEQSVEELKAQLEAEKKRTAEQQRGVQTLLAEKKGLAEKLSTYESSNALDKVIATKYPNFDELDATMQNVVRTAEQSALNSSLQLAEKDRIESERQKERKIAEIMQARPELQERKDEFELYMNKHKDADVSLLANAFIGCLLYTSDAADE